MRFKFDITPKATGERVSMDEVGLYTVKNGKIAEERFYY
nr:SnoaL-like domain-containing protein [Mesorhizobium sp.]